MAEGETLRDFRRRRNAGLPDFLHEARESSRASE
jgi:hypothetical protein